MFSAGFSLIHFGSPSICCFLILCFNFSGFVCNTSTGSLAILPSITFTVCVGGQIPCVFFFKWGFFFPMCNFIFFREIFPGGFILLGSFSFMFFMDSGCSWPFGLDPLYPLYLLVQIACLVSVLYFDSYLFVNIL